MRTQAGTPDSVPEWIDSVVLEPGGLNATHPIRSSLRDLECSVPSCYDGGRHTECACYSFAGRQPPSSFSGGSSTGWAARATRAEE